MKVLGPAITGARLMVTVPFDRVPVAVVDCATGVGTGVTPGGGGYGSNLTIQVVKVTVTIPVGVAVPLDALTLTVIGVLTTSAELETVAVVTESASGALTPVTSITEEFTALLVIPMTLVSVPCSPGPGLKVMSTWQVPPAANGLSPMQVPSAPV